MAKYQETKYEFQINQTLQLFNYLAQLMIGSILTSLCNFTLELCFANGCCNEQMQDFILKQYLEIRPHGGGKS